MHHIILQGRVCENAKTQTPYSGCMVMVCGVCESCEPYYIFTGSTTKYQMILKLIPSERRESVLSYCLIFFPKLHKIDLEITVSKRAVFKTRFSRNLFLWPRPRREGFVKTLTIWYLVQGSVRIRIRVRFNISVCHRSKCRKFFDTYW